MTPRRALAAVAIDDVVVPVPSIGQCKTCQSEFRGEIEALLAAGTGFRTVARSLPSRAALTERNLRDHLRHGHCASDAYLAAQRTQGALDSTGTLAEAVAVVRDELRLARRIVEVVEQRLDAGEVTPSVQDGLNAMSLIAKHGAKDEEPIDHEWMLRLIDTFMAIAENHMAPEVFGAFGRSILANPQVRALGVKDH
jgi:hypothetical protein